jgi:hypothetical protein
MWSTLITLWLGLSNLVSRGLPPPTVVPAFARPAFGFLLPPARNT